MSLFPSCSGLPQVFHGVRNPVPNLHVFLFFLAMPGGERSEGADVLQNWSADTVRSALLALPPPQPFDIHNSNAAKK